MNATKIIVAFKKLHELLPYLISMIEVVTNKDINKNGKVGS